MKDCQGNIDLREGAVVYLNKPLTWSSFSLLNKFRYEACRHLGIKKLKVGHAGTLDPLATGVMVLCTGRCTKLIESLQQGVKEYVATIQLGQTTPTFDMESEPDAFFATEHITQQLIEDILPQFLGEIQQIPPIFSAVKVDGKRAYDLARKGKEVELEPKIVYIDKLELLSYELPYIRLRIVCGKGTYIRSLARDLGIALRSGGHLIDLVRTQVGEARLENCLNIEDIKPWLEAHVERSNND